jgi:hypothetical protein
MIYITGISSLNRTRNQNSGSYEPEHEPTFVDLLPAKPEPELHLETPVRVIRTRTGIEPDNIFFIRIYFHTKTDLIYIFWFN